MFGDAFSISIKMELRATLYGGQHTPDHQMHADRYSWEIFCQWSIWADWG